MHTLTHIKSLLDQYQSVLRGLTTDDENTYNNQVRQIKERLLRCFSELSMADPMMFQMNIFNHNDESLVNELKESIKRNANNRFSLDIIPYGYSLCDSINNEYFITPAYIAWQDVSCAQNNIVFRSGSRYYDQSQETLNSLILNILLGLPVKKVRLNIFDPNMTGVCDLLSTNLPPQLYHDSIVVDSESAYQRIRALKEHMATVMRKYGNLVEYNNEYKEIAMPYEIVILADYPNNYDNYIDDLMPLFQNGSRCGVYFVVLHNKEADLHDKEGKYLLDCSNYQYLTLVDNSNRKLGLINHTPFYANDSFRKMCFDYINEEANCIEERAILKQDFSDLQVSQYEPVMSEISVTVGLDVESKKEVTLRFNSGDYIHAFILGQSGSGKSVLLNNIITTAINKYAPEDLMLYLLDFKGVEFNRYRGVKHAKAVLVDNSDPQMTLEVLRELKEENRKRVKLWQQDGVNNIDGYNRKHPDGRLPQVLFVADECQVMFSRVNAGVNSHTIQREIAEIINIIATQGRSQGIHMLLATQQLDETDISGQVLKNLTECFLLMSAPSDSERLVPDSSDMTAKQPTGQCCYYHKKELQAQVQTYYATDEELEKAIASSQQKASSCRNNGEAYFKGSSMFWFNENEKDILLQEKGIVASVGRTIGMKGNQTVIPLHPDFSENVLFFGANKEEQTVGVVINAMMTLMLSFRKENKCCNFIVIDCAHNMQGKYRRLLEALQGMGYCRIVNRAESGGVLKRLADDIYDQTVSETILVIIGNERFAEIKRNSEINSETVCSQPDDFDVMGDISLDLSCLPDLNGNSYDNESCGSNVRTYQQALKYILDEGPVHGVHTLLQVDKPSNILFEGEYGNNALDKFRHKVMLRSENKYLTVMKFSVDIDVEVLSDEEEHLRAYYYPEDGEPQLFTPYLMPENIDILIQ